MGRRSRASGGLRTGDCLFAPTTATTTSSCRRLDANSATAAAATVTRRRRRLPSIEATRIAFKVMGPFAFGKTEGSSISRLEGNADAEGRQGSPIGLEASRIAGVVGPWAESRSLPSRRSLA